MPHFQEQRIFWFLWLAALCHTFSSSAFCALRLAGLCHTSASAAVVFIKDGFPVSPVLVSRVSHSLLQKKTPAGKADGLGMRVRINFNPGSLGQANAYAFQRRSGECPAGNLFTLRTTICCRRLWTG